MKREKFVVSQNAEKKRFTRSYGVRVLKERKRETKRKARKSPHDGEEIFKNRHIPE